MRTYYVYKHTCPNGKVYIGTTLKTPSYRWNNGKGYAGSYFGKAIQKYGWDNIKHEILFDSLTKEEAEQKEIELISFHKSNQREYGYNIANGGRVHSVSEETKRKIGKANTGRVQSEEEKEKRRKSCMGKKMPRDIIERIAEKNRGQKRTPEQIERSRVAHKGQRAWNKGVPCSEEAKRHLSEINTGAKNPKAKSVARYTLNGEFIDKWESVSTAGNELGINSNSIAVCARGLYKTAGGYIWRYV